MKRALLIASVFAAGLTVGLIAEAALNEYQTATRWKRHRARRES